MDSITKEGKRSRSSQNFLGLFYLSQLDQIPRLWNPDPPFVYMARKTNQTKIVVGAGVPHFFSITEMMMCTGLSRSSINRQIKAGNIPIVRIGSRILIPYSYLETLQTAAEAAVTIKEDKEE